MTLPPLPTPAVPETPVYSVTTGTTLTPTGPGYPPLFSADQMHSYAIAAVAATRQEIIEAMGSLLRCPCCGGTMDCADDCTFLVDCPAEADSLDALREALK